MSDKKPEQQETSAEAKAFVRALDAQPRRCGHVMWACPCVERLFDSHIRSRLEEQAREIERLKAELQDYRDAAGAEASERRRAHQQIADLQAQVERLQDTIDGEKIMLDISHAANTALSEQLAQAKLREEQMAGALKSAADKFRELGYSYVAAVYKPMCDRMARLCEALATPPSDEEKR